MHGNNEPCIFTYILQPSNIEELCSCILTATANSPELKDEAEVVHARFLTLLKQFFECHSLYDCNATTPDKVQHLGMNILSVLMQAAMHIFIFLFNRSHHQEYFLPPLIRNSKVLAEQ